MRKGGVDISYTAIHGCIGFPSSALMAVVLWKREIKVFLMPIGLFLMLP